MGDLLIIGPGKLGLLVAQEYRESNPECLVYLKFRSDNPDRTTKLEKQGFKVLTESQDVEAENVVFCAPPTGNDHYAADVQDGFRYLKPDGLYLFTSSGSVLAENAGGTVNESSERARTERSGKIMDAEDVVLSRKGCVLRLGGLYSSDSGAHNFYASGGEFCAKPGGYINLLNYEDAAEAVRSSMKHAQKVKGELFLVADGNPISRQEIVDATRTCSRYKDAPEVKFTGGDHVDGKKYDVSKLMKITGWKPKYSSFKEFMINIDKNLL